MPSFHDLVVKFWFKHQWRKRDDIQVILSLDLQSWVEVVHLEHNHCNCNILDSLDMLPLCHFVFVKCSQITGFAE